MGESMRGNGAKENSTGKVDLIKGLFFCKGKYILNDGIVKEGYWEDGVRIKWINNNEEKSK